MLVDPLQVVNEIAVICIIILVLLLAWRFRRNLLSAITGDDRIHGTSLDCVWFTCFRCCGQCNGDWTRIFTRWCCCPRRIRGANLLKVMGQIFGFTSYSVELKNIVVGDLPWDRRANFYLSVECASNPPMMTALAEEKDPKVVHFPEVITLRLRFSPLEHNVRITVKELNLLGSTDLCACNINAMHVLEWCCDPGECMKRFVMDPLDRTLERETPAWILLEFDQPTEARDLEHFHGNVNTVRTSTRDGNYRDTAMVEFKHEYTLVDGTGLAIQEPFEEDLRDIRRMRGCVTCWYGCCHFWIVTLVMGYIVFRLYMWSCFHHFLWLTMASLNHAVFPISLHKLRGLVDDCKLQVQGTGIAPGGSPCRPSSTQVLAVCTAPPQAQPRPTAFTGWVSAYLGLEVQGIPCFQGTCELREELVKYDHLLVLVGILLVLLLWLSRIGADKCVRMKRRQMQSQCTELTKMIVKKAGETKTTKGLRTGGLGGA